MPERREFLVLGIGNTLLGDEGAGVRAMERIRACHPDEDIVYVDGGTLSFTLTQYIEETDHLVVIDAANLGGAPGDWQSFIDADMDAYLSKRGRSVHEVSLSDLLDIARLTGRLPKRRALFGIQTQHVDWSDQLTAPVALAVEEVSRAAAHLVAAWRLERDHIPAG